MVPREMSPVQSALTGSASGQPPGTYHDHQNGAVGCIVLPYRWHLSLLDIFLHGTESNAKNLGWHRLVLVGVFPVTSGVALRSAELTIDEIRCSASSSSIFRPKWQSAGWRMPSWPTSNASFLSSG